jgi:hypothetical protein
MGDSGPTILVIIAGDCRLMPQQNPLGIAGFRAMTFPGHDGQADDQSRFHLPGAAVAGEILFIYVIDAS